MPLPRFQRPQAANTALFLACGLACSVLLLVEGYSPRLKWFFVAYATAIVVWGVWVAAFTLSTLRMLSLAVIAALAGYLTQIVGVGNGLWTYSGPFRSFYFVPFMFFLASVAMYGLSRYPFTRLFRHFDTVRSKWPNVLLIAFLVAGFCLDLRRYPGELSLGFKAYYLFLGLFSVYASQLLSFRSLAAVVCSAWIIGYGSEALGAKSGLWIFTPALGTPPFFLVFASWPVEFFLHYALSGIVAGETLDTRGIYTYAREQAAYQPQTGHPMYAGDHRHTVVAIRDEDKFRALGTVLEKSGFWTILENAFQRSRKTKSQFSIVIKPNFMFMYSKNDHSTFTDPELVEDLVRQLREQDYSNLSIVEAQSAYGNYFENRDVVTVAHYLGYSKEHGYRIVDLTKEMVPYTFRGPLGKHYASPTWMNADFRISFAKNKTHTWAFYTLTIKNIYGALPMQNKLKEYHYQREIYYPTIDYLIEFPVHFGLIDAYWSSDGPFGIFADRNPNGTRTVIGGANLVAVDWVGASKMGLDPMVSRYMQLAIQAFGRPQINLVGDGSAYAPWVNVSRDIIEFVDAMEEDYQFSNFVFSVMNQMDAFFLRKRQSDLVRLLRIFTAPLRALVFVQTRRSSLAAQRISS